MISSSLPSHLPLLLEDSNLNLEAILVALKGYYECPKDAQGIRQGPLVGYAGRYEPGNLQYVGDVYLNFAPVEHYPFVLQNLATRLNEKLKRFLFPIDAYLGAPEGGKALALALAMLNLGAQYVYPDRKVITAATEHSREVAKLIWSRHEIGVGDRVAIVEDLNNNFSTTKELIKLVTDVRATPYIIVSFYNRSVGVTGDYYHYDGAEEGPAGIDIPIVTLKSRPIPQHKQDDPFVAEDVAKGNVVWKPKPEWPRLQKAMGL